MTNEECIARGFPMKHLYMGEDINDLPRERLIEIIGLLARDIEQTREMADRSARLMGDIVKATLGRQR